MKKEHKNIAGHVHPKNVLSVYGTLKETHPNFTKDLDKLILESEETGSIAKIVTQDPLINSTQQKEYYVHINPIVSIVSENDLPAYLKRRIKKVGK